MTETHGLSSVVEHMKNSPDDDRRSGERPLIVLVGEPKVGGALAVRILERSGYQVMPADPGLLRESPQAVPSHASLLVSPLRLDGVELVGFAMRAPRTIEPGRLAILAIGDVGDSDYDLQALRAAAISGLVSPRADSNDLVRRVRQIVSPLSQVSEIRAPCFIPAEIFSSPVGKPGIIVSLSPGGVRIAVSERYELNTDVVVRMRLPGDSHSEFLLDGRVTFSTAPRDDLYLQEVGVAFTECLPPVRERISMAVRRILTDA